MPKRNTKTRKETLSRRRLTRILCAKESSRDRKIDSKIYIAKTNKRDLPHNSYGFFYCKFRQSLTKQTQKAHLTWGQDYSAMEFFTYYDTMFLWLWILSVLAKNSTRPEETSPPNAQPIILKRWNAPEHRYKMFAKLRKISYNKMTAPSCHKNSFGNQRRTSDQCRVRKLSSLTLFETLNNV